MTFIYKDFFRCVDNCFTCSKVLRPSCYLFSLKYGPNIVVDLSNI